MKFYLVLLLLCCWVESTYSADEVNCHEEMQGVFSCLKKKHEENKASDDAKVETFKTKIGKCFSDNGCEAPNYDGQNGDTMQEQLNKQPEAVKQCIKDDIKKDATDKVNQCLAKQKVKKLQATEIEDYDLFEENSATSQNEQIKKYMRLTFQAMRKCRDDHPDKSKAVFQCIKPIKDAAKPEICKRIGECLLQEELSEECVDRGKEIRDAMCNCKKEKMENSKKKIEELQKKGSDVDSDQISDTREGDHAMGNYNVDSIEKCVKTKGNGATPPPFLSVLKLRQGGSKSMMETFKQKRNRKITQAQLQQMHDRLEERIKNFECGC